MAYKQLYLLVEGSDDNSFFKASAVKSMFGNKYDYISIVQYAQEPSKSIKNFLKSFEKGSAIEV